MRAGNKKKAGIRDVAKAAGVSTTTVSRVANGDERVLDATRTKVLDVMDELGYDRAAKRRITVDARKLLGVVIPNIDTPGISPYIRGIEEYLSSRGYNIVLCDSRRSSENEAKIFQQLQSLRIPGIIFMPYDYEQSAKAISSLPKSFPVVMMDRSVRDCRRPSALADHRYGGSLATKYLIGLGHKRIACVCGRFGSHAQLGIVQGYRDALAEAGIEFDDSLLVNGGHELTISENAVYQLLDKGVDFSAIFATTDKMAFGVIRALNERSLKAPEDISVVGYDSIELSGAIGLTTIYSGSWEIGREAAMMLVDLIEERPPANLEFMAKSSLVIRKSSRKI